MRRIRFGTVLAAAGSALLGGCAADTGAGGAAAPPAEKKVGPAPYVFAQRDFPDPGGCRVWDPSRKSAEQPGKAQPCDQLLATPPKGAWVLLRHSPQKVIFARVGEDGKMSERYMYDAYTAEYLGTAAAR